MTTTWLMTGALGLPNLVALALLVMGLNEPNAARVRYLQGRAAACLGLVVLGTALGVSTWAWQGYTAVRSDSTVDPAAKARLLAQAISSAMSCLATGLVFTPLPLGATIALFVRARRLAR
jgi:hypothetical protein